MKKLLKYEIYALRAYLELPYRKLLNHQFELEEDYIAEHVNGFLDGKRYSNDIIAFSKEELNVLNPIITANIENEDGKNLLTAFLLTKTVCNIMNKYKK